MAKKPDTPKLPATLDTIYLALGRLTAAVLDGNELLEDIVYTLEEAAMGHTFKKRPKTVAVPSMGHTSASDPAASP
jgi:hypothetical protein